MTASGISTCRPEEALAKIENTRAQAAPISGAELTARRTTAQHHMHESGVDALVLLPGANLRYFMGVTWSMHERLTCALLPREGDPIFIVPAFEEPRLRLTTEQDACFRSWQEDESPYDLVAGVIRDLGAATGRVAIDEQTPYFVVDGLSRAASQVAWQTSTVVAERCRLKKSETEISLIQHAMHVTLEVHRLAAASLQEGATSTDVIEFLNSAHVAAGSDSGSTFAIVAFGESTAYPHGPESPQSLRDGDMVLVDTGCTFHGYHADLTRTYVFGTPTPRQREIWESERDAQQAAFDAVRVGEPCSAVDRAARDLLVSRGYGPDYQVPGLPHRTGHGIGLEIHEPPYLVRGNDMPLATGVCASIEPMLCLYGEVGVRLEDHFYLTDDGPQWFTSPSTDLDAPFGS